MSLVNRTADEVRGLSLDGLDVYALHAKSAQSNREEYAAFTQSEREAKRFVAGSRSRPNQRVIVATNYAETSVTITNLQYVIDSGYIMEPTWDPETCSTEYPTTRHTQAGCTQRKGRVGRTAPGEFFRLYSKKDWEDPACFRVNPKPAVARESMDQFLLAAKVAGVSDLDSFSWLGFDPADENQVKERARAGKALVARGALNRKGQLLSSGVELEGIQVDSVDFARALSESDRLACSLELATFLAFTGSPFDLFENSPVGMLSSARWMAGCYDDLEHYLRVYSAWEAEKQKTEGSSKKRAKGLRTEWARTEGINPLALADAEERRAGFLRQFSERTHTSITLRALDLARLYRVRLVVARSLPEWVYKRQSEGGAEFVPNSFSRCPSPNPVLIDRSSACGAIRDTTRFVCVERARYGERLYAKHIIRVDHGWRDDIDALSPVELSRWAKKTFMPQAQFTTEAAQRVLSGPRNVLQDIANFREGQVLSFRPVKERGDYLSSGALLLAEVTDSKRIFTARLEHAMLFDNSFLRAVVTKVDLAEKTVSLSQVPLFTRRATPDRYRQARLIGIEQFAERRSGRIKLEDGVYARINENAFGRSQHWKSYFARGVSLDVRVLVRDAGVPMAELDVNLPQPGAYADGWVVEVRDNQQGEAVMVFVELSPFAVGMLHVSTIGRAEIDKIGLDECIQVRYLGKDERGRLKVDLGPPEEPEIGAVYDGYLFREKIDESSGRILGYSIELLPGVESYLSAKLLADEELAQLQVGGYFEVLYQGVDDSGRVKVSRAKAWTPAIGQVIFAEVTGSLDSTRDGRPFALRLRLGPGVVSALLHREYPEYADTGIGSTIRVVYAGKDAQGRHIVRP